MFEQAVQVRSGSGKLGQAEGAAGTLEGMSQPLRLAESLIAQQFIELLRVLSVRQGKLFQQGEVTICFAIEITQAAVKVHAGKIA